jgi:hypothetical protein
MGRRADRVERACWRSPYRRSGDRSHLAGLPYMLDRGRHCLFPFHDRRLWFRNRAQRGSSATNDDPGRNAGRPRRWPVPNTAGRHKVITECELGVWRTPTRRVAHSDPACGALRPGMWRAPARHVAHSGPACGPRHVAHSGNTFAGNGHGSARGFPSPGDGLQIHAHPGAGITVSEDHTQNNAVYGISRCLRHRNRGGGTLRPAIQAAA